MTCIIKHFRLTFRIWIYKTICQIAITFICPCGYTIIIKKISHISSTKYKGYKKRQRHWNALPWDSLTFLKSMSDIHFGVTVKKQNLENWKEKNQFYHHLVINLRISEEWTLVEYQRPSCPFAHLPQDYKSPYNYHLTVIRLSDRPPRHRELVPTIMEAPGSRVSGCGGLHNVTTVHWLLFGAWNLIKRSAAPFRSPGNFWTWSQNTEGSSPRKSPKFTSFHHLYLLEQQRDEHAHTSFMKINSWSLLPRVLLSYQGRRYF